MGNIGFREYLEFQRPPKKTIELFRNIPVANIDDNMNRLYAVNAALVPCNKTPLLGVAFTVKVPAGDNLMFHRALDVAKRGDIIVVDGGGGMDRAFCGEIMVKYAIKRGLGGFVVDGCIRDMDCISQIDFPVYSRGTSPNGPYKNGPGEINVPISIGGIVVLPGDILAGDADGLVVIRAADAVEIARKAAAQYNKEARDMDSIENSKFGKNGFDRTWVKALLEGKNCEFISRTEG